MDCIPWNAEVELFQPGEAGDLRVQRTKMPLRDALAAFLALPPDRRQQAGIGLHKPIRMDVDGRPALIGWYDAGACQKLASMMPHPSDL